MSGKLHLKTQIYVRDRQRTCTMKKRRKRTLKREFKMPEIARAEVSWTRFACIHTCTRTHMDTPTPNEGKMQRTLKIELKVLEFAGCKLSWTSFGW